MRRNSNHLIKVDDSRITLADIPEVGAKDRVNVAVLTATDYVQSKPSSHLFICGDGALNRSVRDELIDQGHPETAIKMESFFHHEKKKST